MDFGDHRGCIRGKGALQAAPVDFADLARPQENKAFPVSGVGEEPCTAQAVDFGDRTVDSAAAIYRISNA